MQNPLQDVKDAEKEAKKIIESAQSKKSDNIKKAQLDAIAKIESAEEEMKKSARSKLELKRKDCSDLFSKKKGESEQESATLEKKAEANISKAADNIIKYALKLFVTKKK